MTMPSPAKSQPEAKGIPARAVAAPASESVNTWRIWICGYGEFDFVGTETEAENRRAAKARHECAKGMKHRITNPTEADHLTKQIVDIWDTGDGVPQSLLKKMSAARRAEFAKAPLPALTQGEGS